MRKRFVELNLLARSPLRVRFSLTISSASFLSFFLSRILSLSLLSPGNSRNSLFLGEKPRPANVLCSVCATRLHEATLVDDHRPPDSSRTRETEKEKDLSFLRAIHSHPLSRSPELAFLTACLIVLSLCICLYIRVSSLQPFFPRAFLLASLHPNVQQQKRDDCTRSFRSILPPFRNLLVRAEPLEERTTSTRV